MSELPTETVVLQQPSVAVQGPQGHRRSPLGILFLAVFLDLVGFGILIPIQPFYAELFGARPAAITLLSASFSLVQFLFAPFLGRISDSVGRRPIMLFTIAVNALGYALFGLAGSLPMLFLARITSGFGSANIGTAQAIVADSTSPETRAKGMGIIGAAFGLGFILGPAIGGLFSQYSLALPAFVAAGLSTVNWFYAFLRLPETHPAMVPGQAAAGAPAGAQQGGLHGNVRARHHLGLSWKDLRGAIKHPNVPQLFWLYLVGTVAFSLMEQTLGLYIERIWVPSSGTGPSTTHLRHASAMTAYFLVVVGLTGAVVQGILIGRLARRFGEHRLVVTGTIIVAGTLILIPIVADIRVYALLLALGPILALGSGVLNPSIPSLLSQATDSDAFGGVLGLGQSLSALGRVVGPMFAGVLFEVSHEVPFYLGAALMLTCTLVSLTIRIVSGRRAATGEVADASD
jgi:DHA1 family tetracycline resistance protein-like MFS transporter